jgi:hypothetical protein
MEKENKIILVLIKNGIKSGKKVVIKEELEKYVDYSKTFKHFVNKGVEIPVDESIFLKVKEI